MKQERSKVKSDILLRVRLLYVLFILAGAIVLARLVWVQLFSAEVAYNADRLASRIFTEEVIPAQRGSILSRDGEPLATSIFRYQAAFDFASPGLDSLKTFREQADSLAKLLAAFFRDKPASAYAKRFREEHARRYRLVNPRDTSYLRSEGWISRMMDRYDDTSDEATSEVEQIIYDALKPLYSYDITFEQFRNTQTDANGILTADKIGPSIAKDMTWNAIYSVLFSLIAIGLYITFRFKRWQWASGATAALAFNALLIIGIFSMFYGLLPFNLEVNQAFIAAILTIIGYAINDTVVVFDRIREYLGLYPKRNLKENVNNAINSTLSRTINTSGTTLVTLLAIFFFGGETIRGFIFALIIGVVVGTAATIFLATPIAYDLMTKRAKTDVEK